MKFPLELLSLFLLVAGTLTQDLNLADAVDDDVAPTPEKPKVTKKPDDFDLNLLDALDPDPQPKPKPKPAEDKPKTVDGGGTFGDADLSVVSKGDYEPDGGRSGNTGQDTHDTRGAGGGDQPQEAASGPLAGIISAVGVALVGAASSYFAYQKKKLCFKIQGGEDPERGKEQQGQSDPQVYSNLLKTS